ncbi:MAG: helix-turn-helix domain-containing protein, partial [Cyanobacteria bacterium REEB65]|nr:helix-turn-helix domain-containing protein [Cyanobacteria bacterium REEB65]
MDQIKERSLAAHLGQNLRYIRDRRGMTQDQLSRLADLPRSTIAQLETGQANPTLSVLARVAQALQVSIEELLSAPRSAVQVFRAGTLPTRAAGSKRLAVVHKLLPDAIPGMEIDAME